MNFQQTLRSETYYEGLESFGGQKVKATIYPAPTDTGIIFETKRGEVKANLQNASHFQSAIFLKQEQAGVIQVEHILATLWAYGIDNARIQLERTNPTLSFKALSSLGFATTIDSVPLPEDREYTLCKKIEEVGTIEQERKRKLLTLDEKFETEKLSFFPTNESGLVIKAKINYPVIGEEIVEIGITPESYKNELSMSRSYVKHVPSWFPMKLASAIAMFAYPSYGIGHGFTESRFFTPPKNLEEWRRKEIYLGEIARHAIVDRLGAISLLDRRLDGIKVETYRSGHANDLAVLRELNSHLRQSKDLNTNYKVVTP